MRLAGPRYPTMGAYKFSNPFRLYDTGNCIGRTENGNWKVAGPDAKAGYRGNYTSPYIAFASAFNNSRHWKRGF